MTIKQNINTNIGNNLLDGIKSYNETVPLTDKERNSIKKIKNKCNNGNPNLTDFERQNLKTKDFERKTSKNTPK